MKQYLSIVLAVVSILLAVALVLIKRSDDGQLDTAVGTITDFSNRLDSAQLQIAVRNGNLLNLSNTLAECTSAALSFSNRLTEAQSSIALQTEQITNLTGQVTEAASEIISLGQRFSDLSTQMTNQVTVLTTRLTLTEVSLNRTNLDLVQARKDYALLQNRFLRDVAERVVAERRFNNLVEVQAQAKKLKKNPAALVTPESIYAGLNVLVNSNGTVHVISPE